MPPQLMPGEKMKKLVIFLISFYAVSEINAQWLSPDTTSSLIYTKKPIPIPSEDGDEFVYEGCTLPENEGDSLVYNYYIQEGDFHRVFFSLVNRKSNSILLTGAFRLNFFLVNGYEVKKPEGFPLEFNKMNFGYLVNCWERDLVWTYYTPVGLKLEFYEKGKLVNPGSFGLEDLGFPVKLKE